MVALSLTIASLFILYALLLQPIFRYADYQKFSREVVAQPTLRSRYYLRTIGTKWLWVAVIGVILLLGSVSPANLGARPPDDWTYTLLLVGEIVILLPIALVVIVWRIKKTRRPGLARLLSGVRDLLPHTPQESRLWLLLSVSAGICEEIVFRGFLPWYLLSLNHFSDLQVSLLTAVILSSLLFGFAHLYQGWKGVLATGLIGAFLAYLYVITGSLILPIILHILVDARIVFIAPAFLQLERQTQA